MTLEKPTPPRSPARPKALQGRPRDRSVSSSRGRPPNAVVPTHVRHCYACGSRDWWIYTWRHDNPNRKTRVPYNCDSWRCPQCAKHEAHVTFARIMQACEGLDPRGFCFFVLTLDRDGYYSRKPWTDAAEAYRALSRMSRRFQDRLRTWLRRQGMQPFTNKWIATVEAHRSGWPHVNMVIYCPDLAEYLRVENDELRALGMSEREARILNAELSRIATRSGWGVQSTGEAARNLEASAGYIVKLAGLADKTAGEVAKLTQLPLNAPERFRRLRSGKGFLPPRYKNPEVTGTLVRRERQPDGTYEVVPLHKVAPKDAEHVMRCCYHEEKLATDELIFEAYNRAAARVWPEAAHRVPVVSGVPPPARAPP